MYVARTNFTFFYFRGFPSILGAFFMLLLQERNQFEGFERRNHPLNMPMILHNMIRTLLAQNPQSYNKPLEEVTRLKQ